jgi:FAD:protein FMN transferase
MKKTRLYMDTVVDIEVISKKSQAEKDEKINRAFAAFQKVEETCSRFTHSSELMQACLNVGMPVEISPVLFEPLFFAVEMARLTDGLFDPTVGRAMEEAGFNRHYITGARMISSADDSATYRDIILNPDTRTLTIKKPLVIDLGAVAKGFAIDLAVNELKDFEGFIVNAGGDLFAGGTDPGQNRWKIGIQHPYQKDQMIETIDICNEAVCTSGSYERRNPIKPDEHHLMNPKTKQSANEWVSCSIIAPFAMMADAFSTVSFLLDKENGKILMEELELKGFFITPNLTVERMGGI